MAQDIPRFGFQIAPEISSAERESVSTDPRSSLQRAIRSTQQSTEFHTPKELLLRGPQAFRIAAQAEQERRNMLTSRAQQGINLSNIAIAHRGTQRQHDARRAQEGQAADFVERTRGMDYREALSSMTPQDASSPLTMDILRNMDVLDAYKLSSERRKLDERSMEVATAVPVEQEKKEAILGSQQRIAQLEGLLEELQSGDLADPVNLAGLAAEARLAPEVTEGLLQMAESNPDSVRQISRVLLRATTAARQAYPFNPQATTGLLEKIGLSVGGLASNRELTRRDLINITNSTADIVKLTEQYAASKEQLDRMNTLSMINYRIARQQRRPEDLSSLLKSYASVIDESAKLIGLSGDENVDQGLQSAIDEKVKAYTKALKAAGLEANQNAGSVFESVPEIPSDLPQDRIMQALDPLGAAIPEEEPGNEISVEDENIFLP